MNGGVLTFLMDYVQPVICIFIAPGGLAHICPEATHSIVDNFLLILAPPFCNMRIGEIYDTAIAPQGHGMSYALPVRLSKAKNPRLSASAHCLRLFCEMTGSCDTIMW